MSSGRLNTRKDGMLLEIVMGVMTGWWAHNRSVVWRVEWVWSDLVDPGGATSSGKLGYRIRSSLNLLEKN